MPRFVLLKQNTTQVTIQSPQENSPKTTLKAKSLHFSLLFLPKSHI